VINGERPGYATCDQTVHIHRDRAKIIWESSNASAFSIDSMTEYRKYLRTNRPAAFSYTYFLNRVLTTGRRKDGCKIKNGRKAGSQNQSLIPRPFCWGSLRL
jgi:hypothetical protein